MSLKKKNSFYGVGPKWKNDCFDVIWLIEKKNEWRMRLPFAFVPRKSLAVSSKQTAYSLSLSLSVYLSDRHSHLLR
jgi:hypothetical protein